MLRETGIEHTAPILFIGNVGEEGEGDLRGMRHIFRAAAWANAIGATVVLDGAGTDTIITEGLGSRRYEVTVRGHRRTFLERFWHSESGRRAGANHRALQRNIGACKPKDNFQRRHIDGGTSVNSIPQSRHHARRYAFRFCGATQPAGAGLARRRQRMALPKTNGRKKQDALTAEVRMIGDRPAADLPADSNLLKMMRAVDAHLNNSSRIQRASTDANIPLSLGREAIAIGAGGSGGGAHTVNEWYDPAGRDLGLKRILLLTLALSGVPEE